LPVKKPSLGYAFPDILDCKAMPLIHLIYVSTANTEYDDAELDRILAISERHNASNHVTGMLLYAGGNFMQVLEGEETAVDETYNRIARDPRHKDFVVIERAPIKEREFAQWSMGFRRLEKPDAAAHPSYTAFFGPGFDAAQIGARSGLAMEVLRDFSLSVR